MRSLHAVAFLLKDSFHSYDKEKDAQLPNTKIPDLDLHQNY